jgi:hypothetical protein
MKPAQCLVLVGTNTTSGQDGGFSRFDAMTCRTGSLGLVTASDSGTTSTDTTDNDIDLTAGVSRSGPVGTRWWSLWVLCELVNC